MSETRNKGGCLASLAVLFGLAAVSFGMNFVWLWVSEPALFRWILYASSGLRHVARGSDWEGLFVYLLAFVAAAVVFLPMTICAFPFACHFRRLLVTLHDPLLEKRLGVEGLFLFVGLVAIGLFYGLFPEQ